MPMSNFPGRFSDGVSIGNLPIELTAANNIFWVNNNTAATNTNGIGIGSNANPGTFQLPLASITKALSLCHATKGDLILVAPGHVETVTGAAGIDVNKSGVTIIGLGNGDNKPTINYTTAAGASVDITAASVTLRNFNFQTAFAATSCINIKADAVSIVDCEFRDNGASPVSHITVNSGGSNGADRALIENCHLTSAGATQSILLNEVNAHVAIQGNYFEGSFSTATIQNPTGNILTNLNISENVIRQAHATGIGVNIVSACTGELINNRIGVVAVRAELVQGSLYCNGNRGNCTTWGAFDYELPLNGATPITLTGAIKALPQSTTASAFTIAGGQIRVLFMGCEVTTAIQNQANDTKYIFTDTISTTATDLCAVADIANNAVGTYMWVLGDALATALQETAGGLAVAGNQSLILSPGTVTFSCAASNTGNIKHRITFIPMTPGATVTMA